MDSIVLAHVADAITDIIDRDSDYSTDVDYDEVADRAAALLTAAPHLADAVARWNAGDIPWDGLTSAVRSALTANGGL